MALTSVRCPQCDSDNLAYNDKTQAYVCLDCLQRFATKGSVQSKRIFISYGNDEYAALAQRLKIDLQQRGHEIWFDYDRLKTGFDWEKYIEDGLDWVAGSEGQGIFLLLMTFFIYTQ